MTGEVTQYFGDLMLRYEKSEVIRALVQFLLPGIGGVGDNLISARANKIRAERAQEFFDELDKKGAVLTPAVIESEDFIHCFLVTSKAALNTRRREKIRLFARLLISSVSNNHPRDTDDYEQMLEILDNLTYSEWSALVILDRYSNTKQQTSENPMQWCLKFWHQFLGDVEKELGVPADEVRSFMNAITRSGLYEILIGYMDNEGGIGVLTPRFFRLKNYLESAGI